MNRGDKRLQKERQRERARRFDRQHKLDVERSGELMHEAASAWKAGDYESALTVFEKILAIRPNYVEALERAAEACFILERHERGLALFRQLKVVPRWLPVIYGAAVAAFKCGENSYSRELVAQFLDATKGMDGFEVYRQRAGELGRHLDNTLRGATWTPLTRARTRLPRKKPAPASAGVAPAAEAPPIAPPGPELPDFPPLPSPEIPMRFEFDAAVDPQVARVSPLAEVLLRRDYALLRLQKGFDEMLSPGAVRNVEHLWYQIETVRRVLREFRGRALLADEVGLGKTIEACLVLKEYRLRGLARKVLILVPPSLVSQWLEELVSKFDLAAVSPETGGYASAPEEFWSRHDLVVASLALARQPANRERLAKIEYDMVIVDEAHYVKNRTTAAWMLVNDLKKRFLLLLSATPVGNNLSELYNLILLLRPGLLGTEAKFRRDYGSGTRSSKLALNDPERRDKLRSLLREVMIRNTRSHIDLRLPRRLAATEMVKPHPLETEVFEDLDTFIHRRYPLADAAERFRLTMLRMQAGSSPAALRYALRDETAFGGALRSLAENLAAITRSAKTDALVALASRSREKKVIFTRFLSTLDEVREALMAQGFRVAVFHGSLSASEKDAAIAEFRDSAEILLSSESGGEGRNLQFCNTVINYDLPWNPMAIEQRVGRVHRIGQTREVYVFNFCLAGSVEEYVLRVLHEKINLFELVAGEMEMILGEMGGEQDFASIVMDLWAGSAAEDEKRSAFDRFAGELQRARQQYQQTREADEALFGEDYEV